MTNALTWVGTFHGIGARLLREYAGQIELDPNFTIHDRDSFGRLDRRCSGLSFSKILKRARRRRGLASQELDEIIGVTNGLVAKWEAGLRSPTFFNFWCWSASLGVTTKVEFSDGDAGVRDRSGRSGATAFVQAAPGDRPVLKGVVSMPLIIETLRKRKARQPRGRTTTGTGWPTWRWHPFHLMNRFRGMSV